MVSEEFTGTPVTLVKSIKLNGSRDISDSAKEDETK